MWAKSRTDLLRNGTISLPFTERCMLQNPKLTWVGYAIGYLGTFYRLTDSKRPVPVDDVLEEAATLALVAPANRWLH